ncbi:hypothetical protein QFZ24_009861 [Streptomyces phaeochromogenes]|jgi:hypothetical protein|uniref:hypothetical protein n=1 Tax=Streptomyces phaeochromogenes TaxID=1923 RepID=UPI0027951A90|nr:hypothetical protein [Streptomyces phaeochromogenes]MDQ0955852.1 hypothetical protein [Streptomyces phaeochromogenes]
MSTIDDLLAQSLLLHQPHVPSDVVAYDDLDYAALAQGSYLLPDDGPGVADPGAAQSLAALCEAVVAHCTPEELADFLTDQVPQPRAAWILGCALQLASADDGARFWWQYAAGADDAPASYCLYLQHLARGDTHAAALWQAQARAYTPQEAQEEEYGEDAPAYSMMTADTSLSTVLRILSRLSHAAPRRHTPTARAVIEFVAAAVALGYDRHPDFEIPVPGQYFAEQLETIVAAAGSGMDAPRRAADTVPAGDLPNRPPLDRAAVRIPARSHPQGPRQLLVEVTAAADHEPISAHRFFKEAVAVCWEKATAAANADGPSTRRAYYLNRFRTRAALAFSPAPSGFGTRTPPSQAGAGTATFRGI